MCRCVDLRKITARVAAESPSVAAGVSKFFLVNTPKEHFVLAIRNAEDERVWGETQRYLADGGVEYTVTPIGKPVGPGDLSDLLAPRDD